MVTPLGPQTTTSSITRSGMRFSSSEGIDGSSSLWECEPFDRPGKGTPALDEPGDPVPLMLVDSEELVRFGSIVDGCGKPSNDATLPVASEGEDVAGSGGGGGRMSSSLDAREDDGDAEDVGDIGEDGDAVVARTPGCQLEPVGAGVSALLARRLDALSSRPVAGVWPSS